MPWFPDVGTIQQNRAWMQVNDWFNSLDWSKVTQHSGKAADIVTTPYWKVLPPEIQAWLPIIYHLRRSGSSGTLIETSAALYRRRYKRKGRSRRSRRR